jgi:hypothetical protein
MEDNIKTDFKLGGKLWTEFIWITTRTSEVSCEHGNEFSGSITGEEFLDWLSYC